MKIEGYQIPKSSFLSTEKDMGLIMDKMFKNERLKRLLYYTTKDALYVIFFKKLIKGVIVLTRAN